MGFLDNFKKNISLLSSVKKINEIADNAKHSLSENREKYAYNSMSSLGGGTSSGGAKYFNALNPTTLNFFNRQELIQRSHNLKFESTVYQSIIEWLSVYTVGTGLVAEPTPVFEVIDAFIKIDEEKKKQIRKQIESRLSLILKSKKIHMSEYYDFSEFQKKVFESYIVDGEVFILLNYKHKENTTDFVLSPVRLQIIPAENVRSSLSQNKENQEYSSDGIYYDENGKVIKYSIMKESRDTSSAKYQIYNFEEIEAETKLKQKRIIQISNRNEPNDLRGIPICFNVFHELENIMTAVIAELDAQKNAAMIFGVIERENPETQKSNGFTAAANYRQTERDKLNSPSVTTRLNTPGVVINSLEAGEAFKQLTTERPNTNIPSFIYDVLKPICASKGIPVEVLYGLFGSNYSASRAAIQQFWSAIEQYRSVFISNFLTEAYRAILTELVYAGDIKLPGFLENELVKEAWLNHRWNGSSMPSLDPTQDYEAADMAINLGFATHEQMARELHGSNYSSNLEILSEEKEKRKKLGLLKENEKESVL